MTRGNASVGLLLGLFCALPANVESRDLPAVEERAFARHMTELTNCLAYYSIAQAVLRKSGADGAAGRVDEIRGALLDRTFIVMRLIRMDEDTVLDRQNSAITRQMALIDDDMGNFSVLTEEYGQLCKTVVEDPQARVEHWKGELNPVQD